MMDLNPNQTWLNSREACKALKISACDLSHLREAGKLRFQKKGNAFLYAGNDVKLVAMLETTRKQRV